MKRFQFDNMVPATIKLPVGSPEWQRNLSMSVRSGFEATERNGGRNLMEALRTVLPYKPWLSVPLGRPAGSARAWLEGVTGYPYKSTVKIVEVYDEALAQTLSAACARGGRRGGGKDREENGRTAKTGTDPGYIVNRLQRDNPDLHQQVLDGEMSPNKAAETAGWRPKMWTAPQDLDKLEAALHRRYPGVFTRQK